MKAVGKIICVDGGHFKSLQLLKSSLMFRKSGSGKVIPGTIRSHVMVVIKFVVSYA